MRHAQQDQTGLAAVGADRQGRGNRRGNFWGAGGFGRRAWQQRTGLGNTGMAVPVGQQAIVSDFDESLRENMQQEPADELRQGERHHFFSGVIGIVLVGEGHRLGGGIEREQAAVGDADAMGVAGEVGQHRVRPGERTFGIDHPVFGGGLLQQHFKPAGGGQRLKLAVKLQFAFGVKLAQAVPEFAAIDFGQRPDGKEPVR